MRHHHVVFHNYNYIKNTKTGLATANWLQHIDIVNLPKKDRSKGSLSNYLPSQLKEEGHTQVEVASCYDGSYIPFYENLSSDTLH